MGKEKFQ